MVMMMIVTQRRLLSLLLLLAFPTSQTVVAFIPKQKAIGKCLTNTRLHEGWHRRDVVASSFLAGAGLFWWRAPEPAMARLDPVNRPDLLPKEPGEYVIQTTKYLTTGEAKRLGTLLRILERDTGYRVRVLCQNYPNTPGLAIRDYWDLGKDDQKDDKYVVLVVDTFGGKGNILNFNVGEGIKFALPNVFWTRLQGKYGNTFYVKEKGMDLAIINAIEAIVSCLRSSEQFCVNVPEEGMSLSSLGL
eukprot:CAMPEP_0118680982 /NCGR_PEP_ID=MMETSP0800-20121206/4680_1 /TAXON_ID=210618 ORGANISM="Striatella unipunctata, Strain CCMP2910" /NCGR_SAMPLE_ID=MMETSP0800 /ASSEMBLY_ACC=CAM_ASM_000638 /LENGTH=244 /DNA_ID=CAMNT_0006577217 /DNA_START=582 /DNA_END=1316 /DNA_ORIENTATION=+